MNGIEALLMTQKGKIDMKDVTNDIEFELSNIDGEFLPMTKCICGAEFGYWDFTISIYKDYAKACPKCGRKFIFKNTIKVYEI